MFRHKFPDGDHAGASAGKVYVFFRENSRATDGTISRSGENIIKEYRAVKKLRSEKQNIKPEAFVVSNGCRLAPVFLGFRLLLGAGECSLKINEKNFCGRGYFPVWCV